MQGKTTLGYGRVKEQHVTRFIFWSTYENSTPLKYTVELSNATGAVLAMPQSFDFIKTNDDTHTLCFPLGIDWIVKAFPYPKLFMHGALLKPAIERKVTNPIALSGLILDDLSVKVSPRLFYKNLLSQSFFDSWDKINVALLLLMVAENIHTVLNSIERLTILYAHNYMYFRYINLAYYCRVKVNCCISPQKVNSMLELLSKESPLNPGDICPIRFDNTFDSCRELIISYHDYAANLKSISSLIGKQQRKLYSDSIPLPKGITLIDSPQALAAEGKKMRHCAATYIPELMAKRSFFLHVNNNEAATVQIAKNATKRCFEIVQIKGIANAEVSQDTVNRVRKTISTFDAQRFFFLNHRSSSHKRKNVQVGPTLFDGLDGWQ